MAKFTLSIFVINIIVNIILLQGLLAQGEEISVKERLKLINKPAVKTFLTEYGDTIDCVEIKKQLAFDHPLLKNHTIQMKPSVKFTVSTSNYSSSQSIMPMTVKCPRGTVPIRRIQEKELIAMEKFKPFSRLGTNQLQFKNMAGVFAVMRTYGVSGDINIWNPKVNDNSQFSMAFMYMTSKDSPVPDGVTAGWMVNRDLHGDDKTRLFASWSNENNEGCFNLQCSGFLQTGQTIHLGAPFMRISQYGGSQFETHIEIFQDANSKNWWLLVKDQPIGYWPNEIFVSNTFKTEGATRAEWVGEVSTPLNEGNPAMGSGHFPLEGWGKAAFIKRMAVVPDSPNQIWTNPTKTLGQLFYTQTQPLCFKAKIGESKDANWLLHFYFGGPANCYA